MKNVFENSKACQQISALPRILNSVYPFLRSSWAEFLLIAFHFLSSFRFKTFGGRDPHRPPEDIAFSVARFFQKGGSVQNYYMVSLFWPSLNQ